MAEDGRTDDSQELLDEEDTRRSLFRRLPSDSLLRAYSGYQCVPHVEIWASKDGENYRAWKEAEQRIVQYSVAPAFPPPTEAVLTLPKSILDALPEEHHHADLISRAIPRLSRPRSNGDSESNQTTIGWIIIITRDSNAAALARLNEAYSETISFDTLMKGRRRECLSFPSPFGNAEIERMRLIAQEIAQRCYAEPGSWSMRMRLTVIQAAYDIASSTPKTIPLGALTLSGRVNANILIPKVYDPAQLLRGNIDAWTRYNVILPIEQLVSVTRVPSISHIYSATTFKSNVTVPDYSPQQLQHAADVMNALAARLHSKAVPIDSIPAYVNMFMEVHGANISASSKDKLYVIQETTSGFVLRASSTTTTAFNRIPPNPIRKVPSRDAMFRVVEAFHRRLYDAGSLDDAWEAAAIQADFEILLSTDGITRGEEDSCLEEERHLTTHLCACGRLTICALFTNIEGGGRRCPTCIDGGTYRTRKAQRPSSCLQCIDNPERCSVPSDQMSCTECRENGRNCSYESQGHADHQCENCRHKEIVCDRQLPICGQCEAAVAYCTFLRDTCNRCKELKIKCSQTFPTCAQCNALGIECNNERTQDPRKARTPQEKYFRDTLLGHRISVERIHLRLLGMTGSSMESMTRSRAWNMFKHRLILSDDHTLFTDTYTQHQHPAPDHPLDASELGAFSPELDAYLPVVVIEEENGRQEAHIHHPHNMYPTTSCINGLKHRWDVLTIRIFSELCKGATGNTLDHLLNYLDHLYLVCSQYPWARGKRLQLPIDAIRRIPERLANVERVTTSTKFFKIWNVNQRDARTELNDRRREKRANKTFPGIDAVNSFLSELEDVYGIEFDDPPYLFNKATKPVDWQWEDIRLFYAHRLHVLTTLCNRHFETTCSVQTLFLLHCIQYANPGLYAPVEGFDELWLRREMVPYPHHPMRAAAAHSTHGSEMTTGLPNNFNSLQDFDIANCNISWEPQAWNYMRGRWDSELDEIIRLLRQLPTANEPYWPADLPVLTSAFSLVTPPDEDESTNLGDLFGGKLRPYLRRAPAPTNHPPQANLSNANNICYASSTVQIFVNVAPLRQLLAKAVSFPYSTESGRRREYLVETRRDPDMGKHKNVVKALVSTMDALFQSSSTRIAPEYTLEVLKCVRTMYNDFPLNREDDPNALLATVLEILNCAGDVSSRRDGFSMLDLLEQEHTEALVGMEKGPIKPVAEDCERYWQGYLETGYNSPVTDLCGVQVVIESSCMQPDCSSPYTRSFAILNSINTRIPQEAADYTPNKAYKVEELLELSDDIGNDMNHDPIPCAVDDSHPPKSAIYRRITRLPQVLIIRVDRMGLRNDRPQPLRFVTERHAEAASRFAGNLLLLDDVLDLAPFSNNKHLPSENTPSRRLDDPCGSQTRYRLQAIIQHRPNHFVTYARVKDSEGYMQWVLFNDTESRTRFEDPFKTQRDGTRGEATLIYTQMSEIEERVLAVEQSKSAGASDEDILDELADLDEEELEVEDDINLGDIDPGIFLGDDEDDGEEDAEEEEEEHGFAGLSLADRSIKVQAWLSELVEQYREGDARRQQLEKANKHLQELTTAFIELEAGTGGLEHITSQRTELEKRIQEASELLRRTEEGQSAGAVLEDRLRRLREEVANLQGEKDSLATEVAALKVQKDSASSKRTGGELMEQVRRGIESLSWQDLTALNQQIAAALPQAFNRQLNRITGGPATSSSVQGEQHEQQPGVQSTPGDSAGMAGQRRNGNDVEMTAPTPEPVTGVQASTIGAPLDPASADPATPARPIPSYLRPTQSSAARDNRWSPYSRPSGKGQGTKDQRR